MRRVYTFPRRSPGAVADAITLEKLQALETLLQTMAESSAPPLDVRLILEEEPGTGAWNMAVDEALLESVAAGAPATLRLYRWSAATVSLGYFQRETPEIEPGGRFCGLAAVRRLSGGGAILHHHEVTYSCCIPATHPLASDPTQLYDHLHRQIQQTLGDYGIEVAPRGLSEGDDKPFLCFARGDRRDLVCQGFKVVGSAQRRRRGAILQHGSILLRRSAFLPEFPGVLDLARTTLDERRLCHKLARNCGRVLGSSLLDARLSDSELDLAKQFASERYSDAHTPRRPSQEQPT